MEDFVREYDVGAGETDPFDRCRPSALLGFLQDAATRHADRIGAGRGALVSGAGAIWVLSRIYYELSEPLPGGCRVKVKTWHRGARGALFYRDFEISAGGRKTGFAVSAWAVLDFATRRLLLPARLAECGLSSAGEQGGLSLTLNRLRPPAGMEAAGFHTVSYGDLDINGHANNTRYADFACNALGMERLSAGAVRRVQINYLSECLPGERIGMRLGFSDGAYCVTGTKPDAKPCFEASVQMEKEAELHG